MVFNSDITPNLKDKKLLTREVEDWKVTIRSYDLFPIILLTFDEVYCEAYWPIVNKPMSAVREVMMKLDKQRRENELKKMSENKQQLEKEEAEWPVAQKNQEECKLRGKK